MVDLDLLLTTNNALPTCIVTISLPGITVFAFGWSAPNRTVMLSAHGAHCFWRVESVTHGQEWVQLLIAVRTSITFGLEKRDRVEQVAITWPSGEEPKISKNLTARPML